MPQRGKRGRLHASCRAWGYSSEQGASAFDPDEYEVEEEGYDSDDYEEVCNMASQFYACCTTASARQRGLCHTYIGLSAVMSSDLSGRTGAAPCRVHRMRSHSIHRCQEHR